MCVGQFIFDCLAEFRNCRGDAFAKDKGLVRTVIFVVLERLKVRHADGDEHLGIRSELLRLRLVLAIDLVESGVSDIFRTSAVNRPTAVFSFRNRSLLISGSASK